MHVRSVFADRGFGTRVGDATLDRQRIGDSVINRCGKTSSAETRSECPPQNSYGVWPVNRPGVVRPLFAGLGSAGGAHRLSSTSLSRLICAGWVPHDRVCEMRSGAVLSRRAWPDGAALSVLSGRSSRRCADTLSSPRPLGVAATPSSRAPSSVPRARGRRRPPRSSGACRASRARASARAAAGRCAPPGLSQRGAYRCACVRG